MCDLAFAEMITVATFGFAYQASVVLGTVCRCRGTERRMEAFWVLYGR